MSRVFSPFQDTSVPTTFGILRHSVTEWNQSRRIQGHLDSPLTLTGEALALGWGRLLAGRPWSRILSSDLGRARKTTGLINQALNLPVTLDARLREKDWGKWTGKTVAQLKLEFDKIWAAQMPSDWDFIPPGGESSQNVWKRGREALAAASANWPGEHILVVTHEGMIKSLVYHESTLPANLKNGQSLMPYHLHRMTFRSGNLAIECLNFLDLSPEYAAPVPSCAFESPSKI
jgi:broad specificity phosphatase PhoE